MPITLRYGEAIDHGMTVRCRGCPGCARARQHLWRMRAELETLMAPRTWMFTGTFASQTHDRQEVADEVTRYLKRLRRRLPAGSVRYLFCFERHKSGAWHTHALLHGDTDLRWVDVGDPWTAGFFKANLVKGPSHARYVTKYVAKDMVQDGDGIKRPRIRASRNPRYGDLVMCHDEELVAVLSQRKENLQVTWRKNLRELVRVANEKEKGQLQQILEAAQSRNLTTR